VGGPRELPPPPSPSPIKGEGSFLSILKLNPSPLVGEGGGGGIINFHNLLIFPGQAFSFGRVSVKTLPGLSTQTAFDHHPFDQV
jgi:hypothetical protein